MGSADETWVDVQHRTFTKWLNTQFSNRPDIAPATDLKTGLGDGVRLIQLLEIIGDESLGKFNKNPRLRVQKAENTNVALDYIKSRHISLTNIGAEDIIDGNLKLMLGLLWTLILRFTIADISEEGLTAKEGLLLWCQRKTVEYPDVRVVNFTDSWSDGLAFCALLNRYRPDLLDYEKLDKKDHLGNISLAFKVAEDHIGIPPLLDVNDVCDIARPDERSIMTYIAQYFHAFSHLDKVETAGRRVEKFAETLQSTWSMETDYERRMKALSNAILDTKLGWEKSQFDGSYADAKKQSTCFVEYKKGAKRDWVKEKISLESLLGNIQTKLKTYGLKDYDPPCGCQLANLDSAWRLLLAAEGSRSQMINSKIREIKEKLRRSFADKANDFSLMLSTLSLEISNLGGDLEEQLRHVSLLREHIRPLKWELAALGEIALECFQANVEENDYTIYNYDDLEHEFMLASESVMKKYTFIENPRSKSNITAGQLEEFDTVFRHFDKSGSHSLQGSEFPAALASLGLVYDEMELERILSKVSHGSGIVTYDQFIDFMIGETEDQNSPDQVLLAFRDVGDGKPYVTEMDLKQSLVPSSAVDYLIARMPQIEANLLEQEDEGLGYDYISFMENMLNLQAIDDSYDTTG